MPVDHSYSYYKEADPPYKCIITEFSPHYAHYIHLSQDYNIKKFSNTEFKKIQQTYIYLNNKLLSTKTLMDLAVADI